MRCIDLVEVTKYTDETLPDADGAAAPGGMLAGQPKMVSVGAIGDEGEVKPTSSPFPERLPTTSAHLGATRMDDNTVYGINMVGWALPASVLRTATTTCRCCGVAQYNLAAYQHLIRNKACPANIRYKGPDAPEPDSGGFVMVQVQTTVHMGDKMPFCPNAKLDDGLLDVVLVPSASRAPPVSSLAHAHTRADPAPPQGAAVCAWSRSWKTPRSGGTWAASGRRSSTSRPRRLLSGRPWRRTRARNPSTSTASSFTRRPAASVP